MRGRRKIHPLARAIAGELARRVRLPGHLQRHHGRGRREGTVANLITASRKLGKNADKIPVWEKMLANARIRHRGKRHHQGVAHPKLGNNDAHRHSSQLYPLYDGLPDEIANSPELRSAFIKSVEDKLERYWKDNERGFMSFGIVQLGQVAASLGHGEIAHHCLKHLVNGFWLNNLASMHNRRALFNMDISGGQPSVIIKMLADSFPGKIRLLPALPSAWPTGTIEGVLCRGAIEIHRLHWNTRPDARRKAETFPHRGGFHPSPSRSPRN
jgi:alpha-L-fucosidase 2